MTVIFVKKKYDLAYRQSQVNEDIFLGLQPDTVLTFNKFYDSLRKSQWFNLGLNATS